MNLIINVWHAEKKTQIVALTFFGSELLVYVPFQHIIVMPNLSATRECGSFQLGFFTDLRVIDYFFPLATQISSWKIAICIFKILLTKVKLGFTLF